MAWTYKGGCKSYDEDCCYWNGSDEKEFYDTKELAPAAAEKHFPKSATFWTEVYEVKP